MGLCRISVVILNIVALVSYSKIKEIILQNMCSPKGFINISCNLKI